MSIKTLMSAAHAAGYAMAAEEVADSRAGSGVREGAIVVARARAPKHFSAPRYLRRLWLKAWFADHWTGRATA